MKKQPFYFVCTFNLTCPEVKTYLEKKLFVIDQAMTVEMKLRSKLMSSFSEVADAIELDFSEKFGFFFSQEGNYKIQILTIANPKYAINPRVAIESAEVFGQLDGTWDEHCCAATFFLNDENPEKSEWILKYEIYFADDGIEVAKNGELDRLLAESYSDKFPSVYH